MSLPNSWIDILNKDSKEIRWHEDWVIVRICETEKYITPKLYNNLTDGDKCYPDFILAKPTHSGDITPKSKLIQNPEEGDVFRGMFGNYRIVHTWGNQIMLSYDMMKYAAVEANRLSIKSSIKRNQKNYGEVKRK